MISIVDYGAGNLQSVKNAFDFLGARCRLILTPQEVQNATAIVLPGVGSFGDAMHKITAAGLDDALRDYLAQDRPLLGICLGLHLLFEESEESPGVRGLGVLQGTIRRFDQTDGLKVPHIGWNSLHLQDQSGVFAGLAQEPFVYFVHSYYLKASDPSIVSATATYATTFDAAIKRSNLEAVQFHPEKSGEQGLKMLQNFINRYDKEDS